MEKFYHKCFISDFEKICYFGYFFLLLGISLFILNFFAFIKMTKYYGKMNFENTILLLSSIQSIFILIQLIFASNYFICIFLLIQILCICLLNNKFRKISKGFITIKYEYTTKLIIIINAIYFFIYNVLHIIKLSLNLFYLNIFYFLLEICSSFVLAYHCSIFLGFINKNQLDKNKEEKNISNDKNNDKKPEDKRKNGEDFFGINMIGDGLFYLIKKKQLSLLFLANIICSFLEFIFDIILNFLDSDKSYFYLINYIYYFLFFFHNSIIFISFYWIVRRQYSSKPEKYLKKNKKKEEKLIDDQFIEGEANSIEIENKRITRYLNSDKNINRKISSESSGSEESSINKRKSSGNCGNEKEGIIKKISRNSTFDENDDEIGPDVVNIEDLPSN